MTDKLLHVGCSLALRILFGVPLAFTAGLCKEAADMGLGGSPTESALDMLANMIGLCL